VLKFLFSRETAGHAKGEATGVMGMFRMIWASDVSADASADASSDSSADESESD
jgi:hypothetical protein